jgi:Na+-translocating ferredoxin:NAD+ oxidoreductase subunit B
MSENVFTRLREQLDQYSVGFPETASGIEIEILKRLFTEEEAEMYLKMSLMLEPPENVAERIKGDADAVGKLLERMAEKGLLFRMRDKGEVKYGAAPFVVGIYEYQLNTMDRDLARLTDAYMEEAFSDQAAQQTVPMRPIPVGRSLSVSWPVAPYEDVKEIITSKDKLAVAKCICRVQKGLIDQGCDKPLEVCFMAGSHAQYYVDRGMGRWVTKEEALEILDRCEAAGLVPQPFNAKNPGGMCNCCGDCCGMLRSLKHHPRPAEMVISNYYAQVDEALCAGCEICVDRCQMEAIRVGEDGVALVDRDRCIGCGLCVTTCTTGALTLEPKADDLRRDPPATARETMMELAQKRGKSIIPLSFTGSS